MGRPKCPNHTVEMIPTDKREIWICPVSDARFTCSVDTKEKNRQRKLTLDGMIQEVENWKITPGDGTVNG